MKHQIFTTLTLASTCLLLPAQEKADRHESLRQEIRQAVARGNEWLKTQQKPDGYWDDPELPAFTALALNAAVRDPNLKKTDGKYPDFIEKAYAWLIAQQKPDGGIYNRGLATYNTATALSALAAANRPDFEPAIIKGRKLLIDKQWDLDKKNETDNPNDGGIGYGSHNDHTDLSNTYLAIEALALTEHVVADKKHGDQPELDWQAAVTFISRCQNLPGANDLHPAAEDAKNAGGFSYSPAESKAGEEKLPDGRTALRSYGSMSYAGLLSLIYAKVSADDPRVVAVKQWASKNYTVDENPGMGDQGLYYYYQAMSKALTAANVDQLDLADGKKADWRNDLANKILAAQREDGSWVNSNGRWMESNPVLVTAYCVMSLEQILDSIPTSAK